MSRRFLDREIFRASLPVVVCLVLASPGCQEQRTRQDHAVTTQASLSPTAREEDRPPAESQPEQTSPIQGTDVVLRVGGQVVTYQEFLDRVAGHTSLVEDPGTTVERVIPEVVRDTVLMLYLERTGYSGGILLPFEEKYEVDDWLAYRYESVRLPAILAVTDKELRDALPPEFLRMKASEIAVATNEEIRALEDRIRAGEPFEEIAKKNSISPSSARGGKIEFDFIWGFNELYGDGVEDRLFRARPGEIVGPLETPWGYNLFRVEEISKLGEGERTQIRETARTGIFSGKISTLRAQLEKRFPLQVRPEDFRAAAADPLGQLDRVVARVGENEIPFGVLVALRAKNSGGKDPAAVPPAEWERILRGWHRTLTLREEAVREGYLDDPLVRDNLRRLHKHLLLRKFKENRLEKIRVSEKEVREHFDRLSKRMPPQKIFRLDVYRFPLEASAQAARHALDNGQGAEYLEKMLEIPMAEFFIPKTSVYESTLEPVALEALKDSKTGEVVGPLALREKGRIMHYVVRVNEIVEKGSIPYDRMKDSIRDEIRNRKFEKDIARIIEPEAKKYPVSWVNQETLRMAFLSYLETGKGKRKSGPATGKGGHGGGH